MLFRLLPNIRNLKQVNGNLRDEHKLYLAWMVEQMLELIKKGDSVEAVTALKWPSQQTIRVMDIYETVWECPPAKHMELEVFCFVWGLVGWC